MRPPKIDFRFLFCTPKNMYLKKKSIFLDVTFIQNNQNRYPWRIFLAK